MNPTTAGGTLIGLQPIDWIIIVLYAGGTIGLGVYFGRRQSSTAEYFIGSGNMNPLLIGVSIFATLLSTISYLSMPGEVVGRGPVWLCGQIGLPLVFIIVGYGLLPVYMKQRVTSAYELLEAKLGLSVRMLGAGMFLALRLVWMTILVYLAAKAMTVMLGVDETWIPIIVIVTGTVSVIYTTLGGLRAVVVTDFLQTLLLFGGALLVIATVTYDFGGFGWVPTSWQENWDTQPLFSLDPQVRVTVVGTILSMVIWYVSTVGGDQTSVQRFMATRDAAAARGALAAQLIVACVVAVTLTFVGFALLGYFTKHAGLLPAGIDLKANADDIFPHYISYHLPPGISGLVVAAMFAAAMSSIDSGVNSITAVVMTDLLDRFGLRPKTQKGHVLTARLLALSIGLTVVAASTLVKYIEGNITAVAQKAVNLLTTPIFALFVFALFVPRARALGVWLGAICGTATAAATAFSSPLVYFLCTTFNLDPGLFGVELITETNPSTTRTWTSADPISFQWIAPLALGVNLLVGYVASVVLGWFESRPSSIATER